MDKRREERERNNKVREELMREEGTGDRSKERNKTRRVERYVGSR